ncbi:TPA: hypothetical protein VGT17_005233 [Vibrio harveyi]|nr:hypothetical protein [Vibrio harveyi]HEQ3599231.1 hypothetical protein [Vibrio harveyi]HEQ3611323.1 hypothetical protein [Vibrio harveyi]
MQHTINTLADVIQKNIEPYDAGRELAMAMANDEMSYHDAHKKIHRLMEILESAEQCLSKAAFKELAMDGKRMNPAHMMGESMNKKRY